MRVFVIIVGLLAAWPAAAQSTAQNRAQFIKALDRMMAGLGRQSSQDGAAIRRAYRPHLDLLMLDGYPDLVGALANGGLAPLPSDPRRFNLAPRVHGAHPIGEKDLDNQHSYIAARPATIGALLEVASRVTSGPLEITSLVRHSDYQNALRSTNANATTSVPMHTMGLAFDIALVNTPLETVYEIRDVLREMRDAGDILFIGERRQLVFHVVPHPARLGHFNDVYTRALGAPPMRGGAHVIASSPVRIVPDTTPVPSVIAEVIAVLPTHEVADEWWGHRAHSHADWAADEAMPGPAAAPAFEAAAATTASAGVATTASAGVLGGRLLVLLAALLTSAWRMTARRRPMSGLFTA